MKSTARLIEWMGIVLVSCVAAAQAVDGRDRVGQPAPDKGVKVTITYTGKGEVDASHRLWVWLFDTPDIGPGAIPIAEQSLEKNGTVATFSSVTAGKVWIAVAFDEKGGFAGSAPPPSGSPVSLYTEKGLPAPMKPGPDADVSVSFDDSQRMP